MGICKISTSTIPIIDPNFEIQNPQSSTNSQQNLKSQQVQVSNRMTPSELEDQNNNKSIVNIKQAVSLWKSLDTEKIQKNDDDCTNRNQLQPIDELSKSQLRYDTQPDENSDRQGQYLPHLLLVSNEQKKSKDSPTHKETLISHNMIQSNVTSKPKNNLEQQSKSL